MASPRVERSRIHGVQQRATRPYRGDAGDCPERGTELQQALTATAVTVFILPHTMLPQTFWTFQNAFAPQPEPPATQ